MLAFDTNKLLQNIQKNALNGIASKKLPAFFGRVIYQDAEKKNLIRAFLQSMANEMEFQGNSEGMSVADRLEVWLTLTHSLGAYLIPLMKDSRYEAEAEVRLVYWPSSVEEITPLPKQSVLSGYVTLPVSAQEQGKSRLPLSEVLVGPSPNRDLNLLAAKAFVTRHVAYSNVQVLPSDLPHRALY